MMEVVRRRSQREVDWDWVERELERLYQDIVEEVDTMLKDLEARTKGGLVRYEHLNKDVRLELEPGKGYWKALYIPERNLVVDYNRVDALWLELCRREHFEFEVELMLEYGHDAVDAVRYVIEECGGTLLEDVVGSLRYMEERSREARMGKYIEVVRERDWVRLDFPKYSEIKEHLAYTFEKLMYRPEYSVLMDIYEDDEMFEEIAMALAELLRKAWDAIWADLEKVVDGLERILNDAIRLWDEGERAILEETGAL
jgi:hypothetical protein